MALLDIDVTSLDGSDGFEILGASAGDGAGYAVSSAGDVNGDGFDDLIVGAPGHGSGGAAYVLFGGGAGFSNVDLLSLSPTEGFALTGGAGDEAGTSVASAGDLNGDGFADLLVGAPGNGDAGTDAGAVYVVYGGTGLGDLALWAMAPSDGYKLTGAAVGDQAGFDVAAAGDVDGDGYDDLIIGAYGDDTGGTNAGAAWVVFGPGAAASDVDLAALGGGGYRITGAAAGDRAGIAVAAAGDINADGFDDLIVGAHLNDAGGISAGAAYVLLGGNGSADVDLVSPAADGLRILGAAAGDMAGMSVSAAGDIDGDGFDDLIVGARYNDSGDADAGAAYVILGSDLSQSVTHAGTDSGDVLTGTAFADIIVGGRGDDTITGNGGTDVLEGGAGDDTISVPDLDFLRVDGGGGTDTIILDGSGIDFDLGLIADNRIASIEAIDITGASPNTLTLGLADVINTTGPSNTLAVIGDGDDTVIVTDSVWTLVDPHVGGFALYRSGGATLKVDLDIGDLSFDTGVGISAPLGAAFKIIGEAESDFAGNSVSSAGDVNGDGFDDLIVGAKLNEEGGTRAGAAYVVFGKGDGFANIDLGALAPAEGFKIVGEALLNDAGAAVSSAGDVNGDGFDDLIVGAPGDDEGGGQFAGAAYVVFGKAGGISDIDVGALTPADGFKVFGDGHISLTGYSVSSAGDTNGDLAGTGGADAMVGGRGDDTLTGSGGADVMRGGAGNDILAIADAGFAHLDGGNGTDTLRLDGSGIALDLTAIADNRVNGIEAIDITGNSPNTLTMGIADILGASGTANTLTVVGDGDDAVTVTDGVWTLVDRDDGGFRVFESGAATLKVDTGIEDLEIAARIDLGNLAGGNGFKIVGEAAYDYAGFSASNAGDINGDGFDDVIVGARYNDEGGGSAGAAYVIFGAQNGLGDVDLATMPPSAGFKIVGEDVVDNAGSSVSAAGDVDGDGYDDLVVGAHLNDEGGSDAGAAYVIYGDAAFGQGGGVQVAVGSASSDTLIGGLGEDILHGAAAGDVVDGAEGTDTVDGGKGDDTVSGGAGSDTLTGGDGADVVYGYTDPLSARLDFADGIVFPDVTEVTNIGDLETPGDDALGVADDGFAFGGDAVATLSFVDSQAGYHNTLGLYTIAEDGTIGDVRIVYENVQALSAGDSTVFSVPDLAETDIGFFAVVHGDCLNDGYQGLDLHGGTLSLVFDLGGAGERAAQITDDGADISLVLDDASGRTVLEGPLIHSTERGASATLNADGTVHVASGRADGADAAKLRLGFEDTPGGGDGDYNDVVFDLEVVPINGDGTLSGGDGNDTLVGGAGDDTLLGGNGSDDLVGGAGNDVLIGGDGNDGLTGGVGDDLFVFDDGEGIDTIADFEAGAGSDDVIDVTAVRNIDSFAELQAKFSDNGTDTTIQLDAENSIVVLGVTVADLHQDDFLL